MLDLYIDSVIVDKQFVFYINCFNSYVIFKVFLVFVYVLMKKGVVGMS